MVTHYLKRGNTYEVSNQANLNLHPDLPPGNYVVKCSQAGQFYLDKVEDFVISHKLYGDTEQRAQRILRTFQDRPATTGVMLTGEKGSGKTLLSKRISMLAAQLGFPTLIINTAFCGDEFNSFVQSITQPTVIVFDEFEKVYDRQEQEAVLTLFDGVFPSKKLFLITCNDMHKVNHNMTNRPGRMYYMLNFTGLNAGFIREYCADNLINKSHTESVCRLTLMFDQFNFDMLKALVEEMNRYGETPHQALLMLNIKPELSKDSDFIIELKPVDPSFDPKTLPETWSGNPLKNEISVGYYDCSGESNWHDCEFDLGDLLKIDQEQKKFVFRNTSGDQLTLVRKPAARFHIPAL